MRATSCNTWGTLPCRPRGRASSIYWPAGLCPLSSSRRGSCGSTRSSSTGYFTTTRGYWRGSSINGSTRISPTVSSRDTHTCNGR